MSVSNLSVSAPIKLNISFTKAAPSQYKMKLSFLHQVIIVCFFVIISDVCHANECNNKWYLKNNKKTTITGIVRSSEFYGPPGFGEDKYKDSKYTGYLLFLDCPINFDKASQTKMTKNGIHAYSMADAKKITIIKNNALIAINLRIEDDNKKVVDYRMHNGWRARITGIMRYAILPSDHTPVVLDVIDTKWLNHNLK